VINADCNESRIHTEFIHRMNFLAAVFLNKFLLNLFSLFSIRYSFFHEEWKCFIFLDNLFELWELFLFFLD